MRRRVRYGRKPWRSRWPWNIWFPPVVDERFCKTCGLPHQDGPPPPAIEKFAAGSAGAVVYPAGSWKRDKLVVQVGQWKAGGKLYLSEYILEEHLEDVPEVIAQVRAYIAERKKSAKRKV